MQGFFLCVPDCNKIKDKNNCPFERFPPLGGISCKGVGLKGNSGTKGLGPWKSKITSRCDQLLILFFLFQIPIAVTFPQADISMHFQESPFSKCWGLHSAGVCWPHTSIAWGRNPKMRRERSETSSEGFLQASTLHKLHQICGCFLSHEATPSNHPFRTMGFSMINHLQICG